MEGDDSGGAELVIATLRKRICNQGINNQESAHLMYNK